MEERQFIKGEIIRTRIDMVKVANRYGLTGDLSIQNLFKNLATIPPER